MDPKERGFTLIEALVVMAVIAISVTVALPSLAGLMERQRVDTAMHLLSTDMAMARGSALMKRSQVVLCPGDRQGCRADRDWRGGWIVFLDPDKDRRIGTASDLLRLEASLPDAGGEFTMPASRDFLRFQADGRSANTNLTVEVCAQGRMRGKVVVNNLGRVRTERPASAVNCRRDARPGSS